MANIHDSGYEFTADTDIIQKLDDNPNETDMTASELKVAFDTGAGNVVKAINAEGGLVDAINTRCDEIVTETSTITGDLANLDTTAKTNLVSAINELCEDYITETGTNGTWKWRKWKSGYIELTGYIQHSGITCNIASNGTYYGSGSNGTKNVTLPFTLSGYDFIGYQEQSSRGSGIFVYSAYISGSTLSTEFRNHVSSSGYTCGVRYYIRGTI